MLYKTPPVYVLYVHILEAVRRNPSCAQATELEVENVIKRWFHLAGDREGGRKKRSHLQSIKVENSF